MFALVRDGSGVQVCSQRCRRPGIRQVRVQVELAGVCRTDVAVARGLIPVQRGRTLGHEFVGRIDEVGGGVPARWRGVRVSANPIAADGRMLGVGLDGAFAEELVLPVDQLVEVPDGIPSSWAAYTEPVAAALGAIQQVNPGGPVLVLGVGRIAQLTTRILHARGHDAHCHGAPSGDRWASIIDTDGLMHDLDPLLSRLVPRGVLVLQSRLSGARRFSAELLRERGARIGGAVYGCFDEAVRMIAGGQLDLDPLIGASWPLRDWARAFSASESQKSFLDPTA